MTKVSSDDQPEGKATSAPDLFEHRFFIFIINVYVDLLAIQLCIKLSHFIAIKVNRKVELPNKTPIKTADAKLAITPRVNQRQK